MRSMVSGNIRFFFNDCFEEEVLHKIAAAISKVSFPPREKPEKPDILEGREKPAVLQIDDTVEVVIKQYLRGGILRHFVREHYIHLGSFRPTAEYRILEFASNAGVRVPEPVGYAVQGSLLYRAWLVTKKIPEPVNFIRLCRSQENRALALMPFIMDNIRLLIENRIWHVDLHPGNILIDENDRNHLIDFDKARIFSGSRTRLADKYCRRWERAVKKYGLPASLSARHHFHIFS